MIMSAAANPPPSPLVAHGISMKSISIGKTNILRHSNTNTHSMETTFSSVKAMAHTKMKSLSTMKMAQSQGGI